MICVLMQQKKQNEYFRFFGRWKVNNINEYISIEFNKGGTFNCFGDDSFSRLIVGLEEVEQMFHLFNRVKYSPTWDLRDGKLVIMVSNNEKFYDYNFYNNDTELDLINIENREKLSFIKD